MRLRSNPWLLRLIFLAGLVVLTAGGYLSYRWARANLGSSSRVITWLRNPDAHPEWAIQAGQRCPDAPFILPTNGFVGFLWDASFRPGHRHQGIDIFGGEDLNQTPVVAAYPGFLTRQEDWKSSLIIRIPQDPLNPNRQIWIYYTHMADAAGNAFIAPEFPPGTYELYVEEGTLLGYQGNYSGDPGSPVGTHLHFSIVLDDGRGKWLNELEIRNTVDPSPYLGLPLDNNQNKNVIPVCQAEGQSIEPVSQAWRMVRRLPGGVK